MVYVSCYNGYEIRRYAQIRRNAFSTLTSWKDSHVFCMAVFSFSFPLYLKN